MLKKTDWYKPRQAHLKFVLLFLKSTVLRFVNNEKPHGGLTNQELVEGSPNNEFLSSFVGRITVINTVHLTVGANAVAG